VNKITDKIKSVKDQKIYFNVEAIRKRHGMFIKSTSSEGLHQLVWKIVDNSIDEALAGFATKIKIIIELDNSITVIDNGRGISVDIQAKTGRPAVETVFTILHAGGKFGGGGYKVSGGLHGVGSSVVNALSTQLDVKVYKDGKVYYQEYKQGAVVDDLKVIDETDRHGTTVHFTPDPEIFTETTVFQFDKLATRVRELAFLNRGLKISIEDRREEEPVLKEYHYEGGIKSYVEHLNANKEVLFPEPIFIEGAQQDITIEVSMQYTNSFHSVFLAFVNTVYLCEGGTHESGFKTSLTRVINEYAHRQKIIEEDENLTDKEVFKGLTTVISIKHPNPKIGGPRRTRLDSQEVPILLEQLMTKHLPKFLTENPAIAQWIVEKCKG
jgi:DNA gyrase subunit B